MAGRTRAQYSHAPARHQYPPAGGGGAVESEQETWGDMEETEDYGEEPEQQNHGRRRPPAGAGAGAGAGGAGAGTASTRSAPPRAPRARAAAPADEYYDDAVPDPIPVVRRAPPPVRGGSARRGGPPRTAYDAGRPASAGAAYGGYSVATALVEKRIAAEPNLISLVLGTATANGLARHIRFEPVERVFILSGTLDDVVRLETLVQRTHDSYVAQAGAEAHRKATTPATGAGAGAATTTPPTRKPKKERKPKAESKAVASGAGAGAGAAAVVAAPAKKAKRAPAKAAAAGAGAVAASTPPPAAASSVSAAGAGAAPVPGPQGVGISLVSEILERRLSVVAPLVTRIAGPGGRSLQRLRARSATVTQEPTVSESGVALVPQPVAGTVPIRLVLRGTRAQVDKLERDIRKLADKGPLVPRAAAAATTGAATATSTPAAGAGAAASTPASSPPPTERKQPKRAAAAAATRAPPPPPATATAAAAGAGPGAGATTAAPKADVSPSTAPIPKPAPRGVPVRKSTVDGDPKYYYVVSCPEVHFNTLVGPKYQFLQEISDELRVSFNMEKSVEGGVRKVTVKSDERGPVEQASLRILARIPLRILAGVPPSV